MDIIICTYNNARLLDQVLEAIAQQKVSASHRWSVLVVDNNCTDDTAIVVEKHREAGIIPNLCRVVEPRQGLIYARLCGIEHTTSEWIAFVDDDCLLEQTWVEQAIQFATSHLQCGAFGGKVILNWEQPPSPLLKKYGRLFAAYDRGNKVQQLSRQQFHIPGAGLTVRRSALIESGWTKKQFLTGRVGQALTSGDDSEIVLRILNAGYELWYTPDCTLHHFIPTRRISTAYLINLTYGIGLSAPYIAYLRWNASYPIYFSLAMLRIVKSLLLTAVKAIKSLTYLGDQTEALIEWSWTKGQLSSLLTIFKTNGLAHMKR
jgi:glucosyl-dolichyl phosphate glucuronosyltransferase